MSTTSFTKTPQASDDTYCYNEGDLAAATALYLDVMSDDLGGKAKVLWSIDDGTNDDGAMNGYEAGDLLTQDQLTSGISAWQQTEQGNWIRINNGQVEYRLGNGTTANPDTYAALTFDTLPEGELSDTFIYAIRMANGTLSWATVTVKIQGENDAATIAGDNDGDVTEDGDGVTTFQTATGTLTISDVDTGEAELQPIAAGTAGDNGYGTFEVLANGQWTYTLDNAHPDVQALPDGVTLTDTITVTSEDGTDTEVITITITITGTNDAAVITGTDTGVVTEDATLLASGDLDADDVDGDDTFQPATLAGTYGSLSILADGSWEYVLDNDDPDLDDLDAGEQDTETFTVYSADGTAHEITITVNGANEFTYVSPPVFTGTGDPNDFDELGNPASQTINGTNGQDTIYGGAGNDIINGDNQSDELYGGSGGDTVNGENSGDTLYGGSGNDTINGGNASDTIIGGYGADILTGGAGADTFVYLSHLDTGDTITDFSQSDGDQIDLSAFAPSAFVGALASAGAVAPNEVGYMFSGGDTIVYVDTDGVFGADLEIRLTGNITLAGSDFVF